MRTRIIKNLICMVPVLVVVLVLVLVLHVVTNNPAIFQILDYEHEDEDEKDEELCGPYFLL